MEGGPKAKERVEAVRRALEILTAMARDKASSEFGVSDLSRTLGLPKATIHRLLGTLAEAGFVECNPSTNRYFLGWTLFELGYKVPATRALDDKAKRYLEGLARSTGETASLAVLKGSDVIYVAKVETENTLRAAFPVGSRAPAHATAIGKVQLAALPEEGVVRRYRDGIPGYTPRTITSLERLLRELQVVRDRGWAEDEDECTPGICCIAAPIRDYTSKVVAGISIAGPEQRLSRERRSETLPLLLKAASDCSRDLGFVGRAIAD